MGLGSLFRPRHDEVQAVSLYARIVAQARQAAFYEHCGVPDTVDGRFEMISLHLFLFLHRLKQDHPVSADLGQAVFDQMFHDMDRSLREMGAGDLGVGRRVKVMIQGFYGRVAAYETGLDGGADDLQAALRRNAYGTVEPSRENLAALAGYLRSQVKALATQDYAALAAGEVAFGAPPEPGRRGG